MRNFEDFAFKQTKSLFLLICGIDTTGKTAWPKKKVVLYILTKSFKIKLATFPYSKNILLYAVHFSAESKIMKRLRELYAFTSHFLILFTVYTPNKNFKNGVERENSPLNRIHRFSKFFALFERCREKRRIKFLLFHDK